jgi:hypothetical protein
LLQIFLGTLKRPFLLKKTWMQSQSVRALPDPDLCNNQGKIQSIDTGWQQGQIMMGLIFWLTGSFHRERKRRHEDRLSIHSNERTKVMHAVIQTAMSPGSNR